MDLHSKEISKPACSLEASHPELLRLTKEKTDRSKALAVTLSNLSKYSAVNWSRSFYIPRHMYRRQFINMSRKL